MEANIKTKKALILASKLHASIETQICLINQLIDEIEKSDSISEINKKSRILEANLSCKKAILYQNLCCKYGIINAFDDTGKSPLKMITVGSDYLGI